MNEEKLGEIARWFIAKHENWVQNGRLKSWAKDLEIELNHDGALDEDELFHLFVLAILWNNGKTRNAAIGARVFTRIKKEYTLQNFLLAGHDGDKSLIDKLCSSIDDGVDKAEEIFNTLLFIANQEIDHERTWEEIKRILQSPKAGDRKTDLERFMELYCIFNPSRHGNAWLKVKLFLIFREIRIQFRNTGRYQYNPVVCCIPDTRVRNALKDLKLIEDSGTTIHDYIRASDVVATHFCTDKYDLYDLPLWFWNREGMPKTNI